MDLYDTYLFFQTAFAIVGTVIFVAVLFIFIALYRRVEKIERKLELLAQRGVEAAGAASNIVKTGERFFAYMIYKALGFHKDKDDD